MTEKPLVSIVVRAHARPELLERTRETLKSQRYPSVETIVVDQGESRAAVDAALRSTKGAYVALCDAGDVFFSDHFERLVPILEIPRNMIAYSEGLIAFVDADAGDRITGYARTQAIPVEYGKMLGADEFVAGAARTLIRREALERAGWLSNAPSPLSDYALWLRLLQNDDFVHVDRVTVIHRCVVPQPSAHAVVDARVIEALRTIDALYPVSGRPRLAARRAEILNYVQRTGRLPAPEQRWQFPK
ncbi:MAG TPA: glycosyltransferase family A protein [Candidatus Binatia bacterium]|nr:glycosyltransferase family A protein [Candidatus Binatia bacterium]